MLRAHTCRRPLPRMPNEGLTLAAHLLDGLAHGQLRRDDLAGESSEI
jgi:hypothetical protein